MHAAGQSGQRTAVGAASEGVVCTGPAPVRRPEGDRDSRPAAASATNRVSGPLVSGGQVEIRELQARLMHARFGACKLLPTCAWLSSPARHTQRTKCFTFTAMHVQAASQPASALTAALGAFVLVGHRWRPCGSRRGCRMGWEWA